MTCHEHTWRVERLLVLKSADDGVARIHFEPDLISFGVSGFVNGTGP